MENQNKFFNLLFDEGDTICVSPDKFAYKSILLEDLFLGSFEVVSNSDDIDPKFISLKDIQLVSINPINGDRSDSNVYKFRNFMIELDYGPISDQYEYIKKSKLPYSLCVFSGSKSLHFGISLTSPLPSEDIWRFYMEWILRVLSKADQQAKNPSRSIRMPGNIRAETGKEMKLVEIKTRIELDALKAWLSNFESLKPSVEKKTDAPPQIPDFNLLPDWVKNDLTEGLDLSKMGRNTRWFSIAFELGFRGWAEDDAISFLSNFFTSERDFSKREWMIAVKSGVKKGSEKYSKMT